MKKNNLKKATIALLACLTCVGAFAWLSDSAISNKTSEMSVNATEGDVIFVDELNTITLTANDSIPMTETYALANLTPYEFKIKNRGTVDYTYEVAIKGLSSTFEDDSVMVYSTELGAERVAADDLVIYTGTIAAGETTEVKTLYAYLDDALELDGYTDGVASFHIELTANQITGAEVTD